MHLSAPSPHLLAVIGIVVWDCRLGAVLRVGGRKGYRFADPLFYLFPSPHSDLALTFPHAKSYRTLTLH